MLRPSPHARATGSGRGVPQMQSRRGRNLGRRRRQCVRPMMRSMPTFGALSHPRVGRQKASAKVRRGSASAAGSTSRARMLLPPRFDAASASAATITRTSSQACAAPGCVRMARGSAACGAAHATATPHRCVEAAHSATTTACAAKVSRFGGAVWERAVLLPALLNTRTLSRCGMASFTACTTYPASQCHLSHLQHHLQRAQHLLPLQRPEFSRRHRARCCRQSSYSQRLMHLTRTSIA
mmetsp:Transcript_608/g.1353  ORF Transcript_608/g.1353 Transcript_608/m.1353 type:complete len:239 (-) Transcript_608:414-1130(-)